MEKCLPGLRKVRAVKRIKRAEGARTNSEKRVIQGHLLRVGIKFVRIRVGSFEERAQARRDLIPTQRSTQREHRHADQQDRAACAPCAAATHDKNESRKAEQSQ